MHLRKQVFLTWLDDGQSGNYTIRKLGERSFGSAHCAVPAWSQPPKNLLEPCAVSPARVAPHHGSVISIEPTPHLAHRSFSPACSADLGLLGTSFAGISERGCNPVLGVFKKGPSVCHSHSRLNARCSGTSVTYAELSLRLYETGQSSGTIRSGRLSAGRAHRCSGQY